MKRLLFAVLLAALPSVCLAQWDGLGSVVRDNGTHTGADVWQQDRDAGIKITAQNHDLHDEALATAIENCITRDGQNTPTQNLPMNSLRHTGVANGAARTHYAAVGQVQDNSFHWGGTSTGSGGAFTIALTPALTVYTAGQKVQFLSNQQISTESTPTLNINSLGTKDIKRISAAGAIAPIRRFDINSGILVDLIYDGTRFILLNPRKSGTQATTVVDFGAKSTALGTGTTFTTIVSSDYVNSFDAIDIELTANLSHTAGGSTITFLLILDNALTGDTYIVSPDSSSAGGETDAINLKWYLEGLSAGAHTVYIQWVTSGATAHSSGGQVTYTKYHSL